MLALGDLRSRLRLRGAGGDGGKALELSAGEVAFEAAGGTSSETGIGIVAEAVSFELPCSRMDPSLVR